MGSLLSALHNAGNSLDAYQKAMGVLQNNVANASTAGYVSQSIGLTANAFQPGEGLFGGVQAGAVQSSRNQYAEEAVWNQNSSLGSASSQSANLNSLQSILNVSGTSGIPGALSSLYSSFSAWSTNPTDTTAQQQVLTAAGQFSNAMNAAATNVSQLSGQANGQLQSSVAQINQLAGQIAHINQQRQSGSAGDAGLDASLYNSLEQLSKLTSINVQPQSDGSVSVLMGGQIPLVTGTTQDKLSLTLAPKAGATNAGAPPSAYITTQTGQDVTGIVNQSQGQLSGLLQFRNVALASVTGDGTQGGSLNQLAQSVADRVNTLLTSGVTSVGPPPTPGVPLFSYTAGAPTSVARTLGVANITGSQLAAISTGPTVANGTADQLAQLATSQTAISGTSFTTFYGNIAADIGGQAASASTAETTQTDLLTQAQNARSQMSGVSLNDQAAQLLQFQQSYEAAAHVVSVISQTLASFMSAMQNT